LTVHDDDFYVIAADGSSVTQLTFDGTASWPYEQGRWSRQGTRIAYIRWVENPGGNNSHHQALFVMSADGSGKQRLSPVGMEVSSPSWGP
jgi:Tol biopolymer transport system component